MIFHRRRAVIIQMVICLLFLSFFYFGFKGNFKQSIIFVVLFLLVIIYTLGNYWVIRDDILYKYILFRETKKVFLEEIKLIEAVTNKEIDKLYITIGKGPFEDKYTFILKNNDMIISSAQCKNSNGETLGRYMNKKYKIKLVEKTKYRILT